MIYLGNNPVGLNQNVHFDGQDEEAFYGLALAAGDTTQINSDNALGVYTDEAKIKIQKMLGIYHQPWELIKEETYTNAEEADHIITTDSNGQSFELTDVIMQFELPKQDNYAKKGTWGQIWFYYGNNNGDYIAPEPGQWEQTANSAAHGFCIILERHDNMIYLYRSNQTTTSNTGTVGLRYGQGFDGTANGVYFGNLIFNKVIIKTVTGTAHYRLYGKRKVV